jgi:DNA-binding beta-propeller fold protein YncE
VFNIKEQELTRGVTRINKRQFVQLVIIVALIGTIIVAAYAYWVLGQASSGRDIRGIYQTPKYLYTITGDKKAFLNAPLNVATYLGNIYVADSGNGKLAIFTRNGKLVQHLNPVPEVKSVYPMGITVDKFGQVYLSAIIGTVNKILVFDSRGRFQFIFPDELTPKTGQPSPLNRPVGVYYANNKLYITDVGDQDIKVFDLKGRLLLRVGKAGQGKGELLYPNGVAADKQGNIYVADSNNGRVQVFDSKGRFRYFFKTRPDDPFSLPRGIAIDRLNRVHVVDTFKHKVYVFEKSGQLLFTYGTAGNKEQNLSYPNGIAIDNKADLIFIADRQNNRIAVWGE